MHVASSSGDCLLRFSAADIKFVHIPVKTKSEIDPRILYSAFKLDKYIKENNIEIIHANTRVTQVLGCILRKLSGRPYISTCHGFFRNRFFRRAFPCWGQRVIAISQQVAEHLKYDFKVDAAKIEVIHNGIDLNRFSAFEAATKIKAKETFGLSGAPVVGIIARLSDVKGHAYLIEAMKIVIENIPAVKLLIVGEGREEKRLKNLALGLGIENSLFFVPSVKDTTQALAAIDIFVMPSLQEGLGLGLMEAMACGIPVIGSDVGGIKTLIQNNYNGLLVPAANALELAKAISVLLNDTRKFRDLGEKGRIFINKHFSQEEMVLKTEKVYRQCLDIKD